MGKDNSAAAPIPGRVRIFYSSPRPNPCSRSSPARIALPSSLAYFSTERASRWRYSSPRARLFALSISSRTALLSNFAYF